MYQMNSEICLSFCVLFFQNFRYILLAFGIVAPTGLLQNLLHVKLTFNFNGVFLFQRRSK